MLCADVKITIVVAVYNMEKFLARAMDSILGQTLQEIEAICVDNGSSDNSATIIRKYMEKDARVKAILRKKDTGLLSSRTEGALQANGKYTMFLDSDDYLEPDACEQLYKLMERENVDILQFGAVVHAKPESLEYVENYVKPWPERITKSENIIKNCYVERKHNWLMWNKIFKSSLCKKAAAQATKEYITYGEDMYYYFLLAYYADSYIGDNSGKGYYHYFQGDGISGKKMGADWFRMVSRSTNVCKGLKMFLEKENQFGTFKTAWYSCYNVLATDVVSIWMQRVRREEKSECFDIMMGDWEAAKIISLFAQNFSHARCDIANWTLGAQTFKKSGCDVKTIGVFYSRMYFGGVERVVSILIEKWRKMGYRVILFTDEEARKEDYYISSEVVRIVLPDRGNDGTNPLYERCAAIIKEIRKYKIDVYVIHKWMNDELLWEVMAAKSEGAAVVVETHSTPACMVYENPVMFQPFMKTCALADGIVTLSRVDACIMQNFGCMAKYVPDPVSSQLDKIKRSNGKEHTLLWVGRISPEKQPVEAARIMQELIKLVPDVKLRIVGGPDGANTYDAYYETVKKEFSVRNLDKYVEFCGFQRDVYPYYKEASVLISTSLYEGFSMTILEGLAAALPCVVYDMPNLEFVRRGNAVFAVAPNDAEAAASQIAQLLTQPDVWRQTSEKARKEYEAFRDYDVSGAWKTIFDMCTGLVPWKCDALEPDDYAIAMKTLHIHHTWLLQKASIQLDNCLNGPEMERMWKFQKFSARFAAVGKKEKAKMLWYSVLRIFGIHKPLETGPFSVKPHVDNILWQMKNIE